MGYAFLYQRGVAKKPVLTSIAVTTKPTTTTYAEGATFSTSGMIVTATFDDGSTSVVTGYTYSPTTVPMGSSNITISYTHEGVTKTATVAVIGNRYFYRRGTISHTGSWQTNSTDLFNVNSDHLYVGSTEVPPSARWMVWTTNTVDLSNISTIYLVLDSSGWKNNGYSYTQFGVTSSTGDAVFDAALTVPLGTNQLVTLNVSNVTGRKYFKIFSDNNSGNDYNMWTKYYEIYGR